MKEDFSYKLIRSARRSISIEISPSGEIIVRAPRNTPTEKIEKFIAEKSGWINSHLSSADKNYRLPAIKDGAKLTIIGSEYVVRLKRCDRAFVSGDTLVLPTEETVSALYEFVKSIFLPYVTQKTIDAAKNCGFVVSGVRVGKAQKRWASCSAKKTIAYTASLAFLPDNAVQGVIMHELCHTVHMNHGRSFYGLLGKVMPDYKESEAELRRYAAFCSFFKNVKVEL